MLGILLAFLSGAFYSISYVFLQLGMRQSKEDDNGLFVNLAINVIFLGVIYIIILLVRGEPLAWDRYGLIAFIIAGLLSSFLGRGTLFSGIRRIGSSRAVGIKNTAPVVTIVIAVAFLGERMMIWSGIGMFLIMLGLFFFVREQWKMSGGQVIGGRWIGFFMAAAAAICFGTGQAVRKVGVAYLPDPVMGSLAGTSVALILYGLIIVYRREFKSVLVKQVKNINVYYILSSLCICFGLLLFFTALFFTKLAYVSAVAGIEPVLTVILAYFFLKQHEKLNRVTVLSACLIFGGIVTMALSSLLVGG